MGNNIMVCPIT